jgi:hypothetical protein
VRHRYEISHLVALSVAVGLIAVPTAITVAADRKMERLTFTCDTDAECAALPPCALKPGCDGGPDTQPFRLVGYECEGAKGPLYRDEEDEFPKCGEIKAIWE